MNKTRSKLYKAARILGDVQAVKRGRVGQRIARRSVGRAVGRGLGKSGCYIASCAYADAKHPDVEVLRHFRDGFLIQKKWGRKFIAFYEKTAPGLVARHGHRQWLNKLIYVCLSNLVVPVLRLSSRHNE
ncbi:hypothetical protein LRD18_11950 [Halorhodospira halochloris]|uniref:CFI-box-CTERM domain-containing protein n=1 Tax=Halorhodospira halochloris TaxID=1052 RepID=UPI001EE934AD|nr:CFI-box-CTERM domain-containing protein [Halorhodospira halochloris]MCG5531557.1 hypothetical protein [Halorhodospira halochloris]